MFENIPKELREINQWCCWKYDDIGALKPTKIPFDAKSGKLANVNDENTFSSFEQCLNIVKKYSGIGFIFTDKDDYSFIDLDDTNGDQVSMDRQLKIFHEFDSYSEVSPSGKGLHIIVRGKVPQGRRRSHIEIYSSQRYATFTGNIYNDKPISDRQNLLTQLWEQMGSGGPATTIYNGDEKEVYKDAEIIDRAKSATNGDKFNILLKGEWKNIYPSQSEADIAFINIIAFYTQNRNQITRIFRSSPLGARPKAKRTDYINWMINKSFDNMLPQIDFDGFKIAIDNKIQELNAGSSNGRTVDFGSTNEGSIPSLAAKSNLNTAIIPPGLLGEIAQFIYSAAPRPVPEIALAGAIGFMAGVCGKAYNISGTGLNQYILMIADTGKGKEAMASGISKLVNTVRNQVPVANEFIGPSAIASKQGLHRFLSKKSQCFVSILGEFGLRLQAMSSQFANSHLIELKEALLDLYNKSGHTDVYRGSAYSDQEKNTADIQSPSFSILGESTPERFYGVLNEEMISEGLLPRFTVIEYTGPRVDTNENHDTISPSIILVQRLAELMAQAKSVMANNRVITVQITPDALALTKKIDRYATDQINSTNKEVTRQLWNRSHINVLKLSALIAVGVNIADPVVTLEYVQWAMNIVNQSIKTLSEKFDKGEIGNSSSEIKQIQDLRKALKDFVVGSWEEIQGYQPLKILYENKIIPYGFLSRKLAAMASFRTDKNGATMALKRTIQVLIDSDYIREVNRTELIQRFGTYQRAFIISNMSMLN